MTRDILVLGARTSKGASGLWTKGLAHRCVLHRYVSCWWEALCFRVVRPCVRLFIHRKFPSNFIKFINFRALGNKLMKMSWLDFEVQRSLVKVTIRTNMVKNNICSQDGSSCIFGILDQIWWKIPKYQNTFGVILSQWNTRWSLNGIIECPELEHESQVLPARHCPVLYFQSTRFYNGCFRKVSFSIFYGPYNTKERYWFCLLVPNTTAEMIPVPNRPMSFLLEIF